MGKIIAISNQKGGVGKTTTCVNLGAGTALLGYKTLVIDFDPQGNATSGLGQSFSDNRATMYEVMVGQESIKGATCLTEFENLFLVPSDINLSGAEVELVDFADRQKILKKALVPVIHNYDFVFIDCPPSLGLLTINALIAADSVLIPLQCEYFAMEGMSKLLNTITRIKSNLNPDLAVEGILGTMYDGRNNICRMVLDELKSHFKEYVFKTFIPRNVRLSEAPSYGKPICHYDPKSKGSETYLQLVEEFIKKNTAKK